MVQIRFRSSEVSLALPLKWALLAGVFLVLQVPQVLLAQGIPYRWEAKQYKPPAGIGAPNRVEGAGTRAPDSNCPVVGKPLTALVPSNQFGATVAAYPTFFVYMPAQSPQTSPLPVEFVLSDTNGNLIYKSMFKSNGKSGIVALTLPSQAGLMPLSVGQDYQWSFSIICQADERTRDIAVEGWIRRVALDGTLSNQLKQASLQQQVGLYAGAELWHDALATLVQLRRNYPNDAAIAANWKNLLGAAGLNEIAQEPLQPVSTTTGNSAPSVQP